jgi:Rrf2 family protein
MDRWLAISDGANAALHALAFAASKDGFVSSRVAAEELGVSATYLAKLIQVLVKAGLVEAQRGASGGFAIKGDPGKITCLEVVTAVDGPIPERHCLFPAATCRLGTCVFKRLCDEVAAKALDALTSTSLADVARSY